MREATGNLWAYPTNYIVITTNGYVRNDGYAVMGRGCAREAATKYPTLPKRLGEKIQAGGNHLYFFREFSLFTLPVKHHWGDQADLALIKRSLHEFKRNIVSVSHYVMPRPGCGNGRLSWDMVRPLCVSLPDNVTIISFPEKERV